MRNCRTQTTPAKQLACASCVTSFAACASAQVKADKVNERKRVLDNLSPQLKAVEAAAAPLNASLQIPAQLMQPTNPAHGLLPLPLHVLYTQALATRDYDGAPADLSVRANIYIYIYSCLTASYQCGTRNTLRREHDSVHR